MTTLVIFLNSILTSQLTLNAQKYNLLCKLYKVSNMNKVYSMKNNEFLEAVKFLKYLPNDWLEFFENHFETCISIKPIIVILRK